jgi:hypothetical protein
LFAHGLDGAALANYLARFINDQWVITTLSRQPRHHYDSKDPKHPKDGSMGDEFG